MSGFQADDPACAHLADVVACELTGKILLDKPLWVPKAQQLFTETNKPWKSVCIQEKEKTVRLPTHVARFCYKPSEFLTA